MTKPAAFPAPVEPDELSAEVIILGAGPAGLTAAYELTKRGIRCIVLERDYIVGGLARTVDYKGYLFDLGGHRFYTKIPLVQRIWEEVLGADFLTRPRLSRIYYRRKFFHYPLDLVNVVRGLGPVEVFLSCVSYLKSHLWPERPEHNLAAWVSNRFGRRLFKMFFESYTEKVWGQPCTSISADWAAQRIRGLSFSSLVKNTLRLGGSKKDQIKTLIREFQYPRRGPGMMWTRMKEILEAGGSKVVLNSPVERIEHAGGRITGVVSGGKRYTGTHVISTLAIRDLFAMMSPAAPGEILKSALDFGYRDFITVGLIIRGTNLFPDNWIYVHEPAVQVGRIQNYSNWSPEMSPDPQTTSLGMEYFCTEDDALWRTPDDELVSQARRELASLGLARIEDILDGVVIRVPKAYPVYDHSYREKLDAVRQFLETVPNLQLAGRNGMHRYNNQDHSMLTALMAARNIMGAQFDLWKFHGESEYLEEGLSLSDEDLRNLETTAAKAGSAGSN